MKSTLYSLPVLASFALAFGALVSCSGKEKQQDHSNMPADVADVATAIMEDSASKFAKSVYYPLERPYPLHSIQDSAQMVKYFPTLVDDSLRNKVKNSPDSLWQQIGWRGWTLDDGSYMWIDDGKVYAVNYLSSREKVMLDSLRNEEISSLQPAMQKGWVPVLCAVDSTSGAIFRIDEEQQDTANLPIFRLAGYHLDSDLSGEPVLLLYGTLDVQGTMGNRFYQFADSVGTRAEYSPDIVDDEDSIPSIQLVRKGKSEKFRVKPGYWLDHCQDRLQKFHAIPQQSHPIGKDSRKIKPRILRADTTQLPQDSDADLPED